MELRKAERKQAKIRLGLGGPSGSGKTFSALKIAYGLCGDWHKIAVIDTERGSADLYSHLGEYQVLTLEAPFSPERYIEAIAACEKAGMEVIVVDSITHEWEGKGGCLEIHEQLGGKFQTWAEVTPRHRAFIDSILLSRCHVLTTVRAKVDYQVTNEGSKTKVEKVGMKEVTREGFEYELTLNLQMDMNHNARVVAGKDRTGLFDGKPAFVPDESVGQRIREWCNSGAVETDSPELLKILSSIAKAKTPEELKSATSKAMDLPEREKRKARDAYTTRLGELKQKEEK